MSAQITPEQAEAMSADEWARYQFRGLLSAALERDFTDAEAGEIAEAWPIVKRLLASTPLVLRVDPFLRALPDGLFGRLYDLTQDFKVWSDPSDVYTWPQEYGAVVYILATHEQHQPPTDTEVALAAKTLANVVDVEAKVRCGEVSYVLPYSLLGRPPRKITAKPSETEH
jgi:hypothetical protein